MKKKHYEIVIIVKGGGVERKHPIRADIITAIQDSVAAVEGATVADVERAVCLGEVDD